MPSGTINATKTLTPVKVTTTSTEILTATQIRHVYTKISVTKTKTADCHIQFPRKDPTCTIQVSKTSALATNASATSPPNYPTIGRRVLDSAAAYRGRRVAAHENARKVEDLKKRTLGIVEHLRIQVKASNASRCMYHDGPRTKLHLNHHQYIYGTNQYRDRSLFYDHDEDIVRLIQ